MSLNYFYTDYYLKYTRITPPKYPAEHPFP